MKLQPSFPIFSSSLMGLLIMFWIGPGLSFAQASEPDGLKVEYWGNGRQKLEECWKDGQKNGLFFLWYENGNPKSKELFEGDIRQGVSRYWYENGHKKERTAYKNGKKHGFSILYNPNGKRIVIHRYKNGKLVRDKTGKKGVIKAPDDLPLPPKK